MTRAAYRAWKCRNGVHRWARAECRDCRAPLVYTFKSYEGVVLFTVDGRAFRWTGSAERVAFDKPRESMRAAYDRSEAQGDTP